MRVGKEKGFFMAYALACLAAAAAAAGGTWLLLKRLLDRLARLELGVRDIPATERDLPAEDGYAPRCGGLLLGAGALGAALLGLLVYGIAAAPGAGSAAPRLSGLQSAYIWGGLLLAPLFAAAAFLEDYPIVFRRMPRGIPGWKRLLVQLAVIVAYLAAIWLGGDGGEGATLIPFVGEVKLGIWFYIAALLVMLAVVRGAELAQKADGTGPMTGFFSLVPLIIAAGFLGRLNAGAFDAGVMGVAGAGACLAFSSVDFPPSTAHTGRVGGGFLGGLLCGVAFAVRMPVLLLLIGSGYIIETATALLAWASERLFGKKLGAPLHHMIGKRLGDVGVLIVFSAITALAGAVAAALAIFGE